ncbi:MAG TPA: hypothetical protein VFG74_14910 [Miltoncostaeaceae bacterium]|jgi:hypothetical protein|nr:hypothetical protein [Miltoncostaeaceae bacterium]
MSGQATLPKSAFANIDARMRCPTPDCWGDLMLIPTGRADQDGIPSFQPFTACPLCGGSFGLEEDMSDRDLFLRISWLRANPHAAEDPA